MVSISGIYIFMIRIKILKLTELPSVSSEGKSWIGKLIELEISLVEHYECQSKASGFYYIGSRKSLNVGA